jgi:uncharacterized membrane protein
MKEIHLTRTFLRKPLYGVTLFVGLLLLVEGLAWTVSYNAKFSNLTRLGGLLPYVSMIFRGYILPEMVTAYILVVLLNQYHVRLRLNSIKLTARDITRYEVGLLPVILLSFFVFNPVTQTVRFVMEQFPYYSFVHYWNNYLSGTFGWGMYVRYLMPIFILGYLIVNISLTSDYLKQKQEAQDIAEAEAAQAMQKALALSATFTPKPTTPSPYLSYIKGKNSLGDLDFPVNDVYYFTVEERFYYAYLTKGRYLVSKTLNELETELDASQFFRIKRDYIVNRQAVLNYAYWENGKYIVRLNTPEGHDIIVPRARMHEFREWLQGSAPPYSSTDSLVLAS